MGRKWQNNDTEMHSVHNKGRSFISERFSRTLKNKIYKYMTSIPNNVYIEKFVDIAIKLDDIVNKHNHAYHIIIKMKPVDVKSNTY